MRINKMITFKTAYQDQGLDNLYVGMLQVEIKFRLKIFYLG